MTVYMKYRMENDKFCQILKKSTETNDLELTVLFEEKAFKATVKEKELIESAQKLQKTVEGYTEEIFRGDEEYTAKISDKNTLIFNKQLENTLLKVKVFEHKLNKIHYTETVEKMLCYFSEEQSRSKKEIKRLLTETEELRKIKVKYEEQLEKLVALKNSDEEELYSRFVLILNEKKTQIQHLTQLLSNNTVRTSRIGLKNKRNLQNEEPIPSSSRKTPILKESVSSSASETESKSGTESEDTDAECEKNETVREIPQQPSSSSFDVLDCDDILNDDIPRPKRYKLEKEQDIPAVAEVQEKRNIEVSKLICNKESDMENKEESSVKEVKINAFEINTQDLLDSF